MDAPQHASPQLETIDDLSALAWVQEELRRSLDAAHKALRRYLKEAEAGAGSDVDAVDPGVLRPARAQLHQGVGALELVGLPAAAQLLRASEGAVAKLAARPKKLNAAAVEAIEQASFALLDYLQRMLAGKPLPPVSLFPQYRAVQELAGADRIHPADLWAHDWRWRELPADATAQPLEPGAATRGLIEAQTLALMRQPGGTAAARLSDLFAGLGAGSVDPRLATFWKLAAAFFEGQAQGLLRPDAYSKRVASRLLAQLRIGEGGAVDASERLAQDLLFFCAQAASPGDGRRAPRLAAVRQAYGLAHSVPVDYETPRLGRFDPAWVVQAKKRVAGAKDTWSAAAGGELHRMGTLNEQFSLVGDSIKRLYPAGDRLAAALQHAVAQTVASGDAPPPALAMEVATSVLYLDASLEDADFDHPDQARRVRRLAERITQVAQGAAAEPLEAWMEDLYRRVSDRQTMGSVVQELRASLSETEKAIDQFFREPTQRETLIPVPAQLQAMRGVLSVLGLDEASLAVLRMRDEIDALIQAPADGRDGGADFDRLAGNLGALGFLIDMLSVQPQMAKSLFEFDAASGTLRSVVGGGSHRASSFGALDDTAAPVEPRLIEQAQSLAFAAARPEVSTAEVARDLERLSQEALVADQPVLAEAVHSAQAALGMATDEATRQAVRDDLAHTMAEFVATSSGALTLDLGGDAAPARPTPPAHVSAPPAGQTGLEDDAEMREIFLEEAREVLGNADAALAALAEAPEDVAELTTVRRAFHTLKGSARMVGLTEFGDAAWAGEQLYNARLADAPRADDALLGLSHDLLAYLGDWVDAIAQRRSAGHDAGTVTRAADALRLDGRRDPLALPQEAQPAAALTSRVPDLPRPEDLDLRPLDATVVLAGPAPARPAPPPAAPEVAFELRLADLDGAVAPGSLSPPAAPAAGALGRPDDGPLDLLSLDLVPSALLGLQDELPPAPAEEPVAPAAAAPAPPEAPAPAPVGEPASIEEPVAAPPAPVADAGPPAAPPPLEPRTDAEQFKQVGPLAISIPLFNIYLNEADELSRRLSTELAEWSLELHRPVGETAIALAHSLAGSSATVGFSELSQLARALEHALARAQTIGRGDAQEAALFVEVAEDIRRLLHQFAAGFLKEVSPQLIERLAEHERHAGERLQSLTADAEAAPDDAAATPVAPAVDDDGVDRAEIAIPAPLRHAAAEAAAAPAVPEAEPAPAPAAALPVVQAAPEPEPEPAFEPETASEPEPEPEPEPAAGWAAPAPVDAQVSGYGALPLIGAELKTLAPLPSDDRLPVAAAADALDDEDDIDALDAVDAELWPIFEEEGQDLLPQLASRMRDWARRPGDPAGASACMRTLHTLKGGARLAGAMRLGELAHRLETAIEHLLARGDAGPAEVEALMARVDLLAATFEGLRGGAAPAAAPAAPTVHAEPQDDRTPAGPAAPAVAPAATAAGTPAAPAAIDWSRFAARPAAADGAAPERPTAAVSHAAVRVRAPLLDRLVNHAGEVSITRSRIESDVNLLKGSLNDLTENLERLRRQLRDLELQAETQISSRIEAAKAEGQGFDPLEMDRFTRFQELTRMMAESVNDVATVQRSLQRTLQSAEDELAAQARLTRDMQDDLLRTRMVEFEGLSERLYRVVRQTAKETGKQVRLDLVGGSIEVDRGVLDRMTGAFEHLLRNCITHGIEAPQQRSAAGKDPHGQITVSLTHEGNEVGVEFRDDGAGLNLARIRQRGIAMGLLGADAPASDAELANLIFTPGFSTAEQVTELAGRGVGMDVVRNEVVAMGGRIETATAAGQGTSFKLVLPLTTAVTQVVMLRAGASTVAVPSTLVELVKRASAEEVEQAYASGSYLHDGATLPFFWLGALLQASPRGTESGRTLPVVVVKSAQQRIALHVDEVLGNLEVVVKHLGAQLSRLPGLAGMTLLPSGSPALIYNPVALAALYGDSAWAAMREAVLHPAGPAATAEAPQAPLVLVVDDSLTVRRVTQRLLVREGYRVALAKDGLEGLERLADERPAVLLSDIEMPRMDGFDLVRNLRGDARLRDLPVIMITSRIAQKHRDVAAELGVDHYLGKPYSEEDLLALVARYAAVERAA